MSPLLDTNVVLWWLADAPSPSDEIKARLDQDPDVRVSPATRRSAKVSRW
jgi:PIN domain nuclease of toxin-antitoxin system